MVGNQPMGSGGVEIDMVDGKPILSEERDKAEAEEAKASLDRAYLKSAQLAAEFREHPEMVGTLAEQYMAQLAKLAANDPVCQALEQLFSTFNNTLNIIPRLRALQVRRRMGALYDFMKGQEEG